MEEKHIEGLDILNRIKLDNKVEVSMEEMKFDILKDIHLRIDHDKKARRIRTNMWWAAASILLLFTISGLFTYQYYKSHLVDIQEYTAKNGHKTTFSLPDGTIVTMNSNSVLSYDINSFGKKYRQVTLNGEAFFDVAKNKEVPFIVSTGNANVKVLGTRFNVEGYFTDKSMKVTLESGKVSMNISGTPMEVILIPGQQAIYNKKENTLKKHVVNVDNAIAWRKGGMYFEDMPLEDIAKLLERRYDVKININSDILKKSRYNGAFTKNDNLERVMTFLSTMEPRLKYKCKDKQVLIYLSNDK